MKKKKGIITIILFKMVNFCFTVHFSSLQMWHIDAIKSMNPKLIEQEGIFISIHHEKLTDL